MTELGWTTVPDGVPGELVVGGHGVGLGYLNDPELTAEAFHLDPFSPGSRTGRLYRTGDLVVRTGGWIEFRGRIDRQVKVGGVRIELDEVEQIVAAHPRVRACVVTVRTPPPRLLVNRESIAPPLRRRSLIAYVVPDGPGLDQAELTGFTAARLPRGYLPDTWVELDALPTTPHGKIDHKALPAPRGHTAARHTIREQPAGERERLVFEAVAAVVQHENMGRHDSFLDVGGDSLGAMALSARLGAAGYSISVRDVLDAGGLAEIASRMSTSQADEADDEGCPHEHPLDSTTARRLLLTPEQEGMYFQWALEPDSPYYTYQGVLTIVGAVDWGRLQAAWMAAIRAQPGLLARFVAVTDGLFQDLPHWDVRLPDLEQVGSAAEVRAIAEIECARPFDLENGPCIRVRSFAMAEDHHAVLLTMHEIITDGWGTTTFFEQVRELYRNGTGEPPVCGCRYDRFVMKRLARLTSDDAIRSRKYWHEELAGELPVLQLPSPTTRPTDAPAFAGELIEHQLSAADHEALEQLVTTHGVTTYTALLSAYALALRLFTSDDEVIIGVPYANRSREYERDVNAFALNMLPVRVRPKGGRTGTDLLHTVHDALLSAHAHADVPFGHMLQFADLHRTDARMPVFQTMFNMPTFSAPSEEEHGGLSFSFLERFTEYAKYDCSLHAHWNGDGLVLQLDYAVHHVDGEAARRLLETTTLAVRALSGRPDVPIIDLDLCISGANEPRKALTNR